MNVNYQYLIEETFPGAFTTFIDRFGQAQKVPVDTTFIGPMPSIPMCADYIQQNAHAGAQYRIITVKVLTPDLPGFIRHIIQT